MAEKTEALTAILEDCLLYTSRIGHKIKITAVDQKLNQSPDKQNQTEDRQNIDKRQQRIVRKKGARCV